MPVNLHRSSCKYSDYYLKHSRKILSYIIIITSLEEIECKEFIPTDLFIYCKTLPRWKADPLRLMPHYMDRTMHELKFDAKLAHAGIGVFVLEAMDTELRLDLAVKQIKQLNDDLDESRA